MEPDNAGIPVTEDHEEHGMDPGDAAHRGRRLSSDGGKTESERENGEHAENDGRRRSMPGFTGIESQSGVIFQTE